jgi:hypothetical protein
VVKSKDAICRHCWYATGLNSFSLSLSLADHPIAVCSLSAAVQGMDETVVNGAQGFYKKSFGIGEDGNSLSARCQAFTSTDADKDMQCAIPGF